MKIMKKPIIYQGIDDELGVLFSFKRGELTPNMRIPRRYNAYSGYDTDRSRYIVEPFHRKGVKNLGWRKELYG